MPRKDERTTTFLEATSSGGELSRIRRALEILIDAEVSIEDATDYEEED